MTHSRGVGGSEQHDLRREGSVTPPEHNLRRGGGTTSPREAKLEDPNLPHKPKSAREERRAAEREERQAAGAEGGDESGDHAGGEAEPAGRENRGGSTRPG
jgi:hypothetical protein